MLYNEFNVLDHNILSGNWIFSQFYFVFQLPEP